MAMIKRIGAPTRNTVGAIGDKYIDLKTRKVYTCVSAYRSSNGSVDYSWRETEEPAVIEEPVEEEVVETVVEAAEEEVVEEVEEPAVEETRKPNKYNYNKQFKRQ